MSKPIVYILSNSGIESAALSGRIQPASDKIFSASFTPIILDFKTLSRDLSHEALALILDLPRWSNNHRYVIELIREQYKGPIIMVVSNTSLWASRARTWPTLKSVGFIERPYEDEELIGVLKRILTSKSNRFRIFPRYEVELSATLNTDTECKIRNVSHGGACLQLLGDVTMAVGDFGTLSFALEKEPARDVRFRVAWIEQAGGMMGAEFVQTIPL